MNVKYYSLYLVLLLALACLSRLSTDIYLPSLPNMMYVLNADQSSLLLTLTTFMFGYAVSALIWGIISDRFGIRKSIFLSLLIYIIATLLCITTNSIMVLIISRFFQGFGSGAGTVVSRIVSKDIFTKEQHVKTLTFLSIGVSLSPIIGPILGGYLETLFNWHASFIVLLIIATLSITFSMIFIKNSNNESDKNATNIKTVLYRYSSLLSDRLYIAYTLAISLASCILFIFISCSPFLLQNIMGVNPLQYGFLFATSIIGFILGTIIAQKLIISRNKNAIILSGTIICVVGSLILLILTLNGLLIISAIILPLIIILCGVGMIMPMCQIAVIDLFPNIIGTATGLFFFLQMSTNAITGIFLRYLAATQLTISILMAVVSLFLCISFYSLIFFNQHVKYEFNQI